MGPPGHIGRTVFGIPSIDSLSREEVLRTRRKLISLDPKKLPRISSLYHISRSVDALKHLMDVITKHGQVIEASLELFYWIG